MASSTVSDGLEILVVYVWLGLAVLRGEDLRRGGRGQTRAAAENSHELHGLRHFEQRFACEMRIAAPDIDKTIDGLVAMM